jgi:FkbM family methyltransferase
LQEDYGAPLPFEPRVILDAGAYTGLSTIYLANKYPSAQIFAVEPDPANFRLLKRNVASYDRIRPIHAALWFEDSQLMLRTRPEGHWASSVHALGPETKGPRPSRAVAAICIETLKARFGLERIDLLKVDIEGAEKELFEHSIGWIDEVGAIFIELHDRLRPGCSRAVAAATDGFDQTVVAPMTTLLVNRSRRGA